MTEAAGVIMAGGRSSRMRAGGCATHKALRTVAGVPLIEWNLRALLAAGLDTLFVAVSSEEPALSAWVEGTGRVLARTSGARLERLVEVEPLGTVGAVGGLPEQVEDLLVVNVDNLTQLDLNALLRFHRERGAAATLATHPHLLPVPFGLLELEGDRVRAYREKPRVPIPISSGTYVLGRAARARVERGRRLDVPELVARLLEAGLPVAAFAHEAPWVDVNDEAALAQAEQVFESKRVSGVTP